MTLPWNFMMPDSIGTSYYPSRMTYDMCNGSLSSSMNLHWNQAWDHNLALSSLYMVPQYNFTNFSRYANASGGGNFLLDPMYTLGQIDWQYKTQYGRGLYNADGQFQFPGMGGIMGWQPGVNTSGGSTTTADNPEDAKYTGKTNKLQTLLKHIQDQKIIDDEELAGEIKYALNNYHKEKGAKAQFEFLKKYYDKIDDKTLKENAYKLTIDNVPIADGLQSAGYEELDETNVDREIANLFSDISTAKTNGNLGDNMILGSLASEATEETYPILDVISTWNSRYNGTDGVERNIIKHIFNQKPDNNNKELLVDTAIKPLVNSLCNKANRVMKAKVGNSLVLKQETIDNIEKARENVESAFIKKDWTSLATEYDNLYKLLRLAAAKIEGAKVAKEFGYLEDTQVFHEDMFIDATKEDLKKEGFKNVDNIKIYTNERIGKRQSTTPETAEEKMQALVDEEKVRVLNENQIAELKKLGIEANQAWVDTRTIKGQNPNIYIIKDDKIVKLENVTMENNTVQKIQSGGTIETTETTEENIEANFDAVVKNEQDEKESKTKEEDSGYIINKGIGIAVKDLLDGWTSDNDAKEINKYLNNISKYNVMEFLDGVFSVDKNPTEGLIEKLDDDCDENVVTMKNKMNLVNKFLEKAEDLGLEKDPDYIKLKVLMARHNDKEGNFNNTNAERESGACSWDGAVAGAGVAGTAGAAVAGFTAAGSWLAGTKIGAAIGSFGGPAGTILGGVIGAVAGLAGGFIVDYCDKHTDNEVIDDLMQSLYKKMKTKMAEQAQ